MTPVATKITKDFFTHNRQQLIESVGGGLIVLTGWAAMQWRGDEAAPFEQESNFWYLTGIEEAGWRLVIDGRRKQATLIAPARSRTEEIFDGGISFEEAKQQSGVDEVIPHEQGKDFLLNIARRFSIVHSIEPGAPQGGMVLNPAQKILWQELSRQFAAIRDCLADITALRALKQPEEVSVMQQAINLTAQAFEEVGHKIDTYVYEYEIEADFSHHFRSRGAQGHAYEPIVAYGGNAVTLHYNRNRARIGKNGLILLDVGARLNGYPADITRTYARGNPSKRERAVHAAVQKAHAEIISLLRPELSVREYHHKVDDIMKRGLVELGLLKAHDDEEQYRRYFPHAVSHGLGLDVHDPLGQPRALQPGMVLTVEPGIYIPEERIGVRIEDNILITEKGARNLSGRLSTNMA